MRSASITLKEPIAAMPEALAGYNLALSPDGTTLPYAYDTQADRTGITGLLRDLDAAGIRLRDLDTRQSTLEDIFVNLVRNGR